MNNKKNEVYQDELTMLFDEEISQLHFEGKDIVLSKISKEKPPSLLSQLLNFEVTIPVPVVPIAISLVIFLTVLEYNSQSIECEPIHVINQGGIHAIY